MSTTHGSVTLQSRPNSASITEECAISGYIFSFCWLIGQNHIFCFSSMHCKEDKAVFIKAFNNVCNIYLLLFGKLHIGKQRNRPAATLIKKGANTGQKTHALKNKKHFVSTNFHQVSLLSGQFLLLSELYCIF